MLNLKCHYLMLINNFFLSNLGQILLLGVRFSGAKNIVMITNLTSPHLTSHIFLVRSK